MYGRDVLIIVPCGKKKVWHVDPDHGPCPAKDAYIGTAFRWNRQYAERFADAWVILSAKYGFMDTDFPVDGPYDVSFNARSSDRIDVERLVLQARNMGLDQHETVVVLGGRAYQAMVRAALAAPGIKVLVPFAGLGIGKYLQAVKLSIAAGDSRLK